MWSGAGSEPAWHGRPMIERIATWDRHDRTVALWLHTTARWGPLVRALQAVSRLSDGWLWLVVGLALPLIAPVRGVACVERMVGVGAVNLVLYLVLKRLVARPRPCASCPGIRASTNCLDEFSFPSGHVLHAVAFSILLDANFPGLAYVMWPFVALVAASRVILGLHFVSDVVVGAAIGAFTAALSFGIH
jgi:undecaprenyl-diphosphatase